MKIVRYQDGSSIKWGVIEGDTIREMEGDPFGHFHLHLKGKENRRGETAFHPAFRRRLLPWD